MHIGVLLTQRVLECGVHLSAAQPESELMRSVDVTYQDAKPFAWLNTADQVLESVARFCGRLNDEH